MSETWWTQTVREGLEALAGKVEEGQNLDRLLGTPPLEEMWGGDVAAELLGTIETGGLGGILKPYAIGKFIKQLSRASSREPNYQFPLLRELLLIPAQEFRRISKLEYAPALSSLGMFDPRGTISLGRMANPKTPWHEFAHARTWIPRQGEEAAKAAFLRKSSIRLEPKVPNSYATSPIEHLARGVAEECVGRKLSSLDYDKIFQQELRSAYRSALAQTENVLGEDLLRQILEESAHAFGIGF